MCKARFIYHCHVALHKGSASHRRDVTSSRSIFDTFLKLMNDLGGMICQVLASIATCLALLCVFLSIVNRILIPCGVLYPWHREQWRCVFITTAHPTVETFSISEDILGTCQSVHRYVTNTFTYTKRMRIQSWGNLSWNIPWQKFLRGSVSRSGWPT